MFAPFTDEQVVSLNDYQHAGVMHPFTCDRCRDRLGVLFVRRDGDLVDTKTIEELEHLDLQTEEVVVMERELVATAEGWTCRTCDYRQDWAWAWMADDRWREFGLARRG